MTPIQTNFALESGRTFKSISKPIVAGISSSGSPSSRGSPAETWSTTPGRRTPSTPSRRMFNFARPVRRLSAASPAPDTRGQVYENTPPPGFALPGHYYRTRNQAPSTELLCAEASGLVRGGMLASMDSTCPGPSLEALWEFIVQKTPKKTKTVVLAHYSGRFDFLTCSSEIYTLVQYVLESISQTSDVIKQVITIFILKCFFRTTFYL